MPARILALQFMLLLFAGIGFGGAGAALALARHRWLHDTERDYGMLTVALLLALFGGLCAGAITGWLGVPSLGLIVGWAAYVLTAGRLGVFKVEVSSERERPEPAEPRQRT